MKLSELRKDPDWDIRVFRAKLSTACYYCKQGIVPGELTMTWKSGVSRHYRCGCLELGVTHRESGTAI